MAVLSVNLGIINLFPIPILDGGHLVFFSVEALRQRPLSMRSQEILQQIGLVLLASLMIFVFYNDFIRIFSQG
jgi:regulator of sigma E protease